MLRVLLLAEFQIEKPIVLVIRELFGRDTIRATLLERALLNWIRAESRRLSQQQMAWYREFHPGTRYHTAYRDPDSEPEEPSPPQLTQEVVRPRMRTAAGGGGDPNDPDDDPLKRNHGSWTTDTILIF